MPDEEPTRFRDELRPLAIVIGVAAECALNWGWDEATLVHLVRVCWRWKRDGVVPKRVDPDEPMDAARPPRKWPWNKP